MTVDLGVQTFVNECGELLDAMEQAILCLESDATDKEAIDSLFRAAHTIKGSGGLFGFDAVVAFTHVLENSLDKLRAGKLTLTVELLSTLLQSRDQIKALVDLEVSGDQAGLAALVESGHALLGRLQPLSAAPVVSPASLPAPAESLPPAGEEVENPHWHISLRFGQDLLRNGMDPSSFILCLRNLGEVVQIVPILDALPLPETMDPESLYLGFEIVLRADTDKADIESIFEFAMDDMLLHIVPPHAKLSHYSELISDLPEESLRLGDILLQCKALTPRELERALKLQTNEAGRRPIGEILVEQQSVNEQLVSTALAKQAEVRQKGEKESRSIRVDADKLDRLIDLVGELAVAGSGIKLLVKKSGLPDLADSVEGVTGLVESVRDSLLGLRMVQIGETFKRFRRIVRDVSLELGKDIHLEVTGSETELDKAMVEKIGDPLTHLVRNSLDHGIEPTHKRLERGKSATGTLHLHAYHSSGYVVIEIRDDGGGINRKRVLERAHERGLVDPESRLSDQEIINLIFQPGFSTAETVTGLSGRGVGMDVVKRNIEALRGVVQLSSEEGKGTTVRLQLPLTLAMIDGFLVTVSGSTFVIPLEAVVECLKFSEAEQAAAGCQKFINLRGAPLPFVRLHEVFGHPPARHSDHAYIVVVQFAGERVGLVVDELLGESQIVIKPLAKLFRHARGLSGSTILGSGEVALILDIPALMNKIVSQDQRAVGIGAA